VAAVLIKAWDVCQWTNDAKFVKAGSVLHPMSVKPKFGISLIVGIDQKKMVSKILACPKSTLE